MKTQQEIQTFENSFFEKIPTKRVCYLLTPSAPADKSFENRATFLKELNSKKEKALKFQIEVYKTLDIATVRRLIDADALCLRQYSQISNLDLGSLELAVNADGNKVLNGYLEYTSASPQIQTINTDGEVSRRFNAHIENSKYRVTFESAVIEPSEIAFAAKCDLSIFQENLETGETAWVKIETSKWVFGNADSFGVILPTLTVGADLPSNFTIAGLTTTDYIHETNAKLLAVWKTFTNEQKSDFIEAFELENDENDDERYEALDNEEE